MYIQDWSDDDYSEPVLQLATISHQHFFTCAAGLWTNSLNPLHNIHALYNTAKDDMFAIQPGSLGGAQEKLGSIGVGSCIGHGQDTWNDKGFVAWTFW